jgi:hypothetical protein
MKRVGYITAVVLGLAGLWLYFYPTALIHTRLTVEVETPEGLKTGSGVNLVIFSLEPAIGTRGLTAGKRGEAVVVDLGSRGVLYALLTGRGKDGQPDNSSDLPLMFRDTCKVPLYQGPGDRAHIRAALAASGKRDVPANLIPYMVRFRDQQDPKTVETVEPGNLAAGFGEGVKLKAVTLEVVGHSSQILSWFRILNGPALTFAIGKRLPWLNLPAIERPAILAGGQHWDHRSSSYRDGMRLNFSFFKTGN